MSSVNPPPPPSGDPEGHPYQQFGQHRPEPGPQTEYLEQGGGSAAPASSGGGKGKGVLLAGAGVAVLALAGAGTWAAVSFFGTDAQPAEALPADTLAYASIDVDPSGAQKIEAIKMLNKFPAIRDELKMDSEDDARKRLFDAVQDSGECANIDYAEDIEPWLGTTAGFGVLDAGGEEPAVVGVLAQSDEEAAKAGMAKLVNCSVNNDADDDSGVADAGMVWEIDGDWVILSDTQDHVDLVVDAESTLADDDDFNTWMDEAGDGFVRMYAAPEMGTYLAESPTFSSDLSADPAASDQAKEMLGKFEGGAAVVRFNDGTVELAGSGSMGGEYAGVYGSGAGDLAASLPEDTALAYSLSLGDGWGQLMMDQLTSTPEGQSMIDQLEMQSGMTFPDDLEALLGDSAALSVSSDINVEELANSSDPANLPIGVKIAGDPGEIEPALDKLRGSLGPEAGTLFGSESEGDYVAAGPSADYRSQLLTAGGLGDTDRYQSVIENGDEASSVIFADLDTALDLLSAFGDDPMIRENLAPMQAVGMSAWSDDEKVSFSVKLSTEQD